MKTLAYFSILIFISISIIAQDTIKVMQYNLLYYGLEGEGCTSSNNYIGDKTNYLKTIINYAKPDIFAVNEVSPAENYQEYLLTNVFLLNNLPNYAMGSTKGNYLTQQIYYNQNKFTLVSEDDVTAYPRNIFVYKFYYNSPDLENGADTVFFYYFVAHLKAGNEPDDADDRATAANNLMNYIDYHVDNQNYILSGDMNLYTSSEQAYQYLTNYSVSSIRFTDPGPTGDWSNNSTYSQYQTQSAFYTSNGCGSGGGLDDRFDFIFFSNGINQGGNKIKYIDNSFKVIGQDGNHFNDGVSYGGNSSVPSDVLNALANNSDHLPVEAKFLINQSPAKIHSVFKTEQVAIKINSLVNDLIHIKILDNSLIFKELNLDIYNLAGQKIRHIKIKTDVNSINYNVNVSDLTQGMYRLKFYNEKKFIGNFTIIKI